MTYYFLMCSRFSILVEIPEIIKEEEIRGDKIRYWEDVNIGDKIPTLVTCKT